jgi:hypothetical protein
MVFCCWNVVFVVDNVENVVKVLNLKKVIFVMFKKCENDVRNVWFEVLWQFCARFPSTSREKGSFKTNYYLAFLKLFFLQNYMKKKFKTLGS